MSDPENKDPIYLGEGMSLEPEDENMEMGLVDDPNNFDMGIYQDEDAGMCVLLVFKTPKGPKSLCFRFEANEKFLTGCRGLLTLFQGNLPGGESPDFDAPTQNQKKPTLH
jgi:hypothetical protein